MQCSRQLGLLGRPAAELRQYQYITPRLQLSYLTCKPSLPAALRRHVAGYIAGVAGLCCFSLPPLSTHFFVVFILGPSLRTPKSSRTDAENRRQVLPPRPLRASRRHSPRRDYGVSDVRRPEEPVHCVHDVLRRPRGRRWTFRQFVDHWEGPCTFSCAV